MEVLEKCGVDGKDIRVIKNLYWKQKTAVRVGNMQLDWQSIKRGVRQGCGMSPDVFNLYSVIMMEKIKEMSVIVARGKKHQ